MKKRGLIIAISGAVLFFIALGMATSVVSNSSLGYNENVSVPKLFNNMFDYVSDETMIQPGTSGYFSFTVSKDKVPLFWGIQVMDYQENDQYTIRISNIFGDSFGVYHEKEPMVFKMLQIEKADTYNFRVDNYGKQPISVTMMFTEDPDNSSAFNNPDSPVSKIIIPILISGILFIIGIIALVFGVIIFVYDWKNEKKSFV